MVTLNFILPQTNLNIVYAMEQAFGEVKAYHGIMEITQTNEDGIVTTQAVREVWADKDGNYYVKELEGTGSGITTINNGQKKWQIDTDLKEVYQFPSFPDPYHFTFEIGSEIENVKNALEVKVVGEAEIAGRETSILSVRPQGGDSYRLWVDQETNMPLQKESAFQNAIQYKVTYKDIKFLDSIPKQLISYQLHKGYKEIASDTEQFVGNLDEAAAVAGFIPTITDILPEDFVLSKYSVDTEKKEIKTYYLSKDKQKTAVIAQHKATGNWKPDSSAILGKVNNNTAEISTNAEIAAGNMGGGTYGGITGISSIRWQEDGMEYTIYGELTMEDLSNFAESISQGEVSIPNSEAELQDKPQVEVPYDLEVEKNEQKSVDAGHSPWKLDPVFVTQVFASLLISPEGIVGDYPIAYEDINIIKNNGEMAIAEIKGDVTTVGRVYLKRLVRQDSTGIWTVIGYDPVKK
ncbi:LolA family protein [Anaerocolumna sedimenticola]|uniref:LolA family protein n=1 Tax=Anaerocolumna sedimenticola TaxID=2696063 RepID=UPI001FE3617E|nr:sigma-E factor regulatory protein RseB domain-containing protein [Anaerocolumna sedimenticola]